RIAGLACYQSILGDADFHSPASELLAWLECEPNDPARRQCRRETARVRCGDNISFQIPPENRFKLLYAPRWRPCLPVRLAPHHARRKFIPSAVVCGTTTVAVLRGAFAPQFH